VAVSAKHRVSRDGEGIMSRTESAILRRLCHTVLSFSALGMIAALGPSQAQARLHRHHAHFNHSGHAAHAAHLGDRESGGGYEPPYAAIVVDANSGKVLDTANPDSPRHPASLTKIMTLYVLFEELNAGKFKLDSRLTASAHAAAQEPSKLGLEPGQTIEVEDAIKAIVTKSANDVAVVVAEAIGGTEDEFARIMTRKAHALGMTHTTYVNASGLPNDAQITTARDLALLGRAIQDDFPKYYRYFSTLTFQYHGASVRNHNHLLGRVEGVDGIKTGYTRASGFNLVSSVRRGDRRIVAVVLGGSSSGARDARMRSLIEAHIAEASSHRTGPLAEASADDAWPRPKIRSAAAPSPVVGDRVPSPRADAPGAAIAQPGSAAPIQPIQVKTISVKPGTIRTASLASLVNPAPEATATTAPAPAAPPPAVRAESTVPSVPSLGAPPSILGTLVVHVARSDGAPPAAAVDVPMTTAPDPRTTPASKSSRGSYMIQVGAFDDEAEAKERLKTARSMAQNLLNNADPLTERVVKGSKEFYRARFTGLEKDNAEAACQYLHKNDIVCMALRSN
jgi:D-alanyl-D-alanine carboxypeptidase